MKKRHIITISMVCAVTFLVCACGFQPMYGKNKYTAIGVEEKLALVDIANIPNREGQFLRNELIDRFYRNGRPERTIYTLSVKQIIENRSNLDVTTESDSTRAQLRLSSGFTLTSKQNNEAILQRTLHAISSYNVLNSEFATRVSEENARQNALSDLARQIEQQINLHLKHTQ